MDKLGPILLALALLALLGAISESAEQHDRCLNTLALDELTWDHRGSLSGYITPPGACYPTPESGSKGDTVYVEVFLKDAHGRSVDYTYTVLTRVYRNDRRLFRLYHRYDPTIVAYELRACHADFWYPRDSQRGWYPGCSAYSVATGVL